MQALILTLEAKASFTVILTFKDAIETTKQILITRPIRKVPGDTYFLIAGLRRSESTQKYTTKPRNTKTMRGFEKGFADTLLL